MGEIIDWLARGMTWGVLVMAAVATLYRFSRVGRALSFERWREKVARAWRLDALERRQRLRLVAQALAFVLGLGWSYLTEDPRAGLQATWFWFGALAVVLRAKRVLDLSEQSNEAIAARELQARQFQ
jgi:hypothetical protein